MSKETHICVPMVFFLCSPLFVPDTMKKKNEQINHFEWCNQQWNVGTVKAYEMQTFVTKYPMSSMFVFFFHTAVRMYGAKQI